MFGSYISSNGISNHIHNNDSRQCSTLLMSKKANQCEFELQELKAQVETMIDKGVASANLTPEKNMELSGYVEAICEKRDSPIPLRDIGMPENAQKLQGKWRLAYCTENAAMSVMPREARIIVDILDSSHLNYELEFTKKVQGLSKITAESTFVIDCSPINPGLVTFSYESITSEVFGMTVPVGFFGLLKGRSNYIESMYFDGKVWIERGYGNVEDGTGGGVFYNVYIKDDDRDS